MDEQQQTSPETTEAEVTQEGVKKEVSLLDQIINESDMVLENEEEKEYAKDMIGELVRQVMKKTIVVSKDLVMMINDRISAIDNLITTQLNEVMHKEEFQKLEASWRGLKYLVKKSETGSNLKIRVLNVSKKELFKDMEKAVEFDQSAMFKKVFTEEYDMAGAAPYGALIGDYEFTRSAQDVFLLEKISQVAAAAHAPFISAASPRLFGMESFTQIGEPRDLEKIFSGPEYIKWNSFRNSEDSRYVALTLPHVLMRSPYGTKENEVEVETFDYEEGVDGSDHSKYLWGNAAYALGTRLTDAFAKYQWCAAIRGREGGGIVEGLPVHTFKTDEGDVALKCPTEIAIAERRDNELANNGFISLVHYKGTDFSVFFKTQSTNKPKKYDLDAANANARLSSQLQYMLAVSRFAHYMKAIMRDKIGSFMSRKDVEHYLNRWISNYVSSDETAAQEIKAQFPLYNARVDVTEVPGKPGAYRAVAFLRPHFQLDELTVSLRLVADIPPPKGG